MKKNFLTGLTFFVVLNLLFIAIVSAGTNDYEPQRGGLINEEFPGTQFTSANYELIPKDRARLEVEFNRFVDDTSMGNIWNQVKGGSYESLIPWVDTRGLHDYVDEREFITGLNEDIEGPLSDQLYPLIGTRGVYQHTVAKTFTEGDIIQVAVMLHNNATTDMVTASNTKVRIDWNDINNIKGIISASNMSEYSDGDNPTIISIVDPYDSNKRAITDKVTFSFDNQNYNLVPTNNIKVLYKEYNPNVQLKVAYYNLENNKVEIDENNKNILFEIGDFVSCYPYQKFVYFDFKVIPATQDPACNSAYGSDNQTTAPYYSGTWSTLQAFGDGLCDPGSVGFNASNWSWTCTEASTPITCYAKGCGDGTRNGSEVCDYSDPNAPENCTNECTLGSIPKTETAPGNTTTAP